MDGKGRLAARNWEFSGQCVSLESALKASPDISASEDAVSHHQAPFLKMGEYHKRNSMISESEMPSMNFTWVPQRNFLSATRTSLGATQQTDVNPEMSNVPRYPASTTDALLNHETESKPIKSRKRAPSAKKTNQVANKVLKTDQPKKQSSASSKKKSSSASPGKREKKNPDIVYGVTFDFSGVPAPVCSCTGVPRQCYRWGAGGWQSSCCTTMLSEYPLPMSTSRPGARLAGRKMSIGAYGKLLQRLAAEGYDLSHAVDLKNQWARHGTNKFVTIR